jgi:hypothetical protein
MPDMPVSLITSSDITDSNYDHIIKVDDLDETDWKLSNDWQVYQHTPYDRTIKLEVDMYIPRRIDHWWSILEGRDLNICTTIRDYKNRISDCDYYRAAIKKNNLPDTYNAITYFKRSAVAEQFYEYVKDIFSNPEEYAQLIPNQAEPRITTDTAYAIAAAAVGVENATMPNFTDFSMIHMKRFVNDLKIDRWQEQLTYEILPHTLRIATHPQMYPFHYHVKEFASIIDMETGDE